MKGTFFTLEAIISITMMVLITVLLFKSPPAKTDLSRTAYKLEAYSGLEMLETGDLREYVLNNNTNSIETELAPYVSFSRSQYSVVIWNETRNRLSALPSPSTGDIISVGYFIAGDVGNYTPREVRVFLWGFD